MQRGLTESPGLIRYTFLIESPVACCTFSIWDSEASLPYLSRYAPSHVSAVRQAKRPCRDIWSAYWRIDAISKTANRWEGPDRWPAMVSHPVHPHLLCQSSSQVGNG